MIGCFEGVHGDTALHTRLRLLPFIVSIAVLGLKGLEPGWAAPRSGFHALLHVADGQLVLVLFFWLDVIDIEIIVLGIRDTLGIDVSTGQRLKSHCLGSLVRPLHLHLSLTFVIQILCLLVSPHGASRKGLRAQHAWLLLLSALVVTRLGARARGEVEEGVADANGCRLLAHRKRGKKRSSARGKPAIDLLGLK